MLHAAIHKARPEVIGAAHAHSTYGKAWASLGRKLDPITQDACIFYDDHTVISEQGGKVCLKLQQVKNSLHSFPTGKAAIHQNHGLFTVGTTVEAAAFCLSRWIAVAKHSCLLKLQEHQNSFHTNRRCTPNNSRVCRGWLFQFQPLFQEICATDPDLFD